jgi:RimJ/RimL family protein N-acetyltransferase
MFQTIKTIRLELRAFEATDAEALAAYRNLPKVAALQTWQEYTLNDAEKLIAQMQHLEQPTAFEWYQIAVTLEKKLIGDLAFKLEDRQAEIGFSFDPVFQGLGYAKEAATALLKYAFIGLKLHRLHATTDPRNTSSIRLLEQLGFRQEGHLQQNFWFKGAWVDDLLFGLLARDWVQS